ncbi:SpoIID/LytB domain-containing protein [Clostridium prolinivorans]|uniref:SpoIID/LytB domain-containing protein n=1 Tax=Clostridium prolinivorans TaxID=2769420 RepID=UPI000FD90DC6|nr:SpoIID/LytB domain-containing protein [Clostridium prolinivorans]
MKKLIIINIILIIISLIIFFPRSIEHGIVLNSNSKSINVIINGKEKKYIYEGSTFPKFTVINFKYNLLKAYDFEIVNPIEDRIMLKTSSYYDMENSGQINLSKKKFFYNIDKNNNISLGKAKDIIIGKNNIKSFKNKKGELKTFIVFPIDYTTIRVGLSSTNFSSIYHKNMKIKCNTNSKLYSIRDKFSIDIPKESIIFIEPKDKNLKITINNTNVLFKNRVYLSGNDLSIESLERGNPSFTPVYNGIVEFNILKNGMTVINEVNIEDYLSKVVPSEMPSFGGIEALKCQAVAARTYAISDMISNRFENLGFHVDDSTKSQVYNNIEQNSLATEAVISTKGIIMTYKDNPIDAKYYSTSAGTGADYKDVWFKADGTSDNKPYIQNNNYLIPKKELPKSEKEWLDFFKNTNIKAIDSNYPYFRWKVEYSKSGITTALNKTLKNLYSVENYRDYITVYKNSKKIKEMPILKDIKDIKILKRGKSGIVKEISFIFSNAVVNVQGDSYIRSSIKCNEQYTNEKTVLIRQNGTSLTNIASLPSSFFSVEKNEKGFILYGGGFGHGAGMSQYGAIELSKNGIKYKDILNIFYKGINIESIY